MESFDESTDPMRLRPPLGWGPPCSPNSYPSPHTLVRWLGSNGSWQTTCHVTLSGLWMSWCPMISFSFWRIFQSLVVAHFSSVSHSSLFIVYNCSINLPLTLLCCSNSFRESTMFFFPFSLSDNVHECIVSEVVEYSLFVRLIKFWANQLNKILNVKWVRQSSGYWN